MAVREIKTTLAVDGEKAFNKAITESGRNMRVMASEMKAAAADFNLTGDEMEYLGRKSKSLNDQIRQQEAIIQALEGAVRDSAKAYGDASAKTDGYRIKLNNAQASLSKLRKELEDNEREMRELGSDAGRVGRQLEQGLGEAADDVSRKMDGLINTLDRDLSDIGGSVEFSAFKDGFDLVQGSISGAYDALQELTEGTIEYRRTMSYLEQNAVTAGMDPELIKNMTIEVSALTGELDGAVEGMSNLMATGFEEDELATAVERLSAAVIQFPDTLKFESLADSLQESVATAQATGQYAEYLERMGADLDAVNKSFEEAAKKGPEAVETVALAWLNNPNAEAALERYEEVNKDLIEGQKAQQLWNDEVARTADILQPVITRMTELKTQALGIMNDIMSGSETIDGEAADSWWAPYRDRTHAADRENDMGVGEGFKAGFEATKKQIGEWFDGLFSSEDTAKAEENADTAGRNIATSLGDGLASQEQQLTYQAALLFRSIEAELNKPIAGPTVNAPTVNGSAVTAGGTSAGTGANVTMELDGRTLGKATVEYNSDAMGAAVDRMSIYG